MSRALWDRVGPYEQQSDAVEDMQFFYKHILSGGRLHKVGGDPLLQYRIHGGQISHKIHRNVLLRIKATAFSAWVTAHWPAGFGIWGCGRDGKKFYHSLSDDAKRLVRCFYEIDERRGTLFQGLVPIKSLAEVAAPFVCCVSIGKRNGIEERLAPYSAGVDYFQIT
jgi:hypothetical protein